MELGVLRVYKVSASVKVLELAMAILKCAFILM